MKRYTDPIFALSLVLVLCCATAGTAQECPQPCRYVPFEMVQGWYLGGPVWFVGLASSSLEFGLPLVPKLASATAEAGGSSEVYLVTNANNFGPVFSTAPGLAAYSGLWDLQYVTWKPGVTPWVITRTDVTGVPPGLPDATQADIMDSDIIFNLPIVAIGPLGGPWYPAPAGSYRIKQGSVKWNYAYTKRINLPLFAVFCRDQVRRWTWTEMVLITDASEQGLADCLGANLAPALEDVDTANRQAFWFIQGGPYRCQLPVLEYCPLFYGNWAPSQDYSPIMDFLRLGRSASLPPWTVINNPEYVKHLLTVGLLTELADITVINATVLHFKVQKISPNGG